MLGIGDTEVNKTQDPPQKLLFAGGDRSAERIPGYSDGARYRKCKDI